MRSSLAHPDLEELAAWLEGRVDEPTAQRLAAHAASCEDCAELLDEMMAMETEMAQGVDGGPAESEHDSAAAEFQPSEFAAALPAGGPSAPRRFRSYVALALAACAAVVGFRLYAPWTKAELADLQQKIGDQVAVRGTVDSQAVHCRAYLDKAGSHGAVETLRTCLEVAKTNEHLRFLFVHDREGRLPAWFAIDALRPGLCSALEKDTGSAGEIPAPYKAPCAPLLQSTENDPTTGS